MVNKGTGLKYKFITLSISAIVLSAAIGSLAVHLLVKWSGGYAFSHVVVIAAIFVSVGVAGVLLVTKLMIQPVVSLTEKVYEVQRGNLEIELGRPTGGTRLDEMDRLFEGFGHMVRHLRQNINALTEAKERAEQYSHELFESKKKLEAIFNGISDGIMVISRDFRIVNANPVIQRIMGESLEAIRGQHCYEMCNGTPQRCSFCKAESAFRTGDHMTSYCTKYIESLDDEKIFEVHDFPLYNEDGEIDQIIEYVKDVTEAVRMQATLESSKRLAMVGELAAKVAHEVRNPLNAIKGAAHYLRSEVTSKESVSYLALIEEQVERVNQVAKNLLDLSKPLEAVIRPGNLQEVVERSLMVAQPQLEGKKIQVKKDVSRDLPSVPLDEGQMEQALVNLILNSVDAMENGGTLHVAIEALPAPKQNGPGSVRLRITDTGCGIPQDHLAELFTPFFTTKTKGTGLGLTIVKKIIENHQGHLEVHSEVEKGTEVVVTLPVEFCKNGQEIQIHDFGRR
ncbi:MAG: PAS domain-containing protein [Calditrichaeota bacterium]|nr:MAG: PAS domain-containing protein [Calditrichota bacterium]